MFHWLAAISERLTQSYTSTNIWLMSTPDYIFSLFPFLPKCLWARYEHLLVWVIICSHITQAEFALKSLQTATYWTEKHWCKHWLSLPVFALLLKIRYCNQAARSTADVMDAPPPQSFSGMWKYIMKLVSLCQNFRFHYSGWWFHCIFSVFSTLMKKRQFTLINSQHKNSPFPPASPLCPGS